MKFNIFGVLVVECRLVLNCSTISFLKDFHLTYQFCSISTIKTIKLDRFKNVDYLEILE